MLPAKLQRFNMAHHAHTGSQRMPSASLVSNALGIPKQPASHEPAVGATGCGNAQTISPELWRLGYKTLLQEVRTPQRLRVLQGRLPRELQGTLYRNGPGAFEVGSQRLDDWFDGDGMVHAMTLRDGQIWYCNRYVETQVRTLERRAGRPLFAGFSGKPWGGPIGSLLGLTRRNPSNTNVLRYGNKLLSMSESGWPYALDPLTLATLGKDDLTGALGPQDTFSAHPKRRPNSDDFYNFGLRPRVDLCGYSTSLHLLRLGASGKIDRVYEEIPLPFNGLVHDFVLTQHYAIVMVPPMIVPSWPVGLMMGTRSASESLRWQPELGTRILVLDLEGIAAPRWLSADAFFSMHTINAWESNGDLIIDVLSYSDASVLSVSQSLLLGKAIDSPRARIQRLRLDSSEAVQSQVLVEDAIEFPRCLRSGEPTSSVYVVRGEPKQPMLTTLARLSVCDTRVTVTQAPNNPGLFYGEGVPVSAQGKEFVLSLALNGSTQRSELHIFDGHTMAQGPICTAKLPHRVPNSLHGSWHSLCNEPQT